MEITTLDVESKYPMFITSLEVNVLAKQDLPRHIYGTQLLMQDLDTDNSSL